MPCGPGPRFGPWRGGHPCFARITRLTANKCGKRAFEALNLNRRSAGPFPQALLNSTSALITEMPNVTEAAVTLAAWQQTRLSVSRMRCVHCLHKYFAVASERQNFRTCCWKIASVLAEFWFDLILPDSHQKYCTQLAKQLCEKQKGFLLIRSSRVQRTSGKQI